MGRETASAMEWKFLKPRYICGGGYGGGVKQETATSIYMTF